MLRPGNGACQARRCFGSPPGAATFRGPAADLLEALAISRRTNNRCLSGSMSFRINALQVQCPAEPWPGQKCPAEGCCASLDRVGGELVPTPLTGCPGSHPLRCVRTAALANAWHRPGQSSTALLAPHSSHRSARQRPAPPRPGQSSPVQHCLHRTARTADLAPHPTAPPRHRATALPAPPSGGHRQRLQGSEPALSALRDGSPLPLSIDHGHRRPCVGAFSRPARVRHQRLTVSPVCAAAGASRSPQRSSALDQTLGLRPAHSRFRGAPPVRLPSPRHA